MDGLDASECSTASCPRAAVAYLTFSPPSAAPGAQGALRNGLQLPLRAGMHGGGSVHGSTVSPWSWNSERLAAATLGSADRIQRRASSGLGSTSTSRLVPNLFAAARMRNRRTENLASEPDIFSSVLSATPPLFSSHQGCVLSQANRRGTLSTAVERVIQVERKRAGKVRASGHSKPMCAKGNWRRAGVCQ
jgi:hypothetical protein